MRASAVYSGEHGYHYPQQQMYPVQYQQGYANYYPANYQQAYFNSCYPANVQQANLAHYYQTYYPQQHSPACYCPSCGTPVYVVYMGEQQGNNNGLALLVVATLVLIALDILFLRHK